VAETPLDERSASLAENGCRRYNIPMGALHGPGARLSLGHRPRNTSGTGLRQISMKTLLSLCVGLALLLPAPRVHSADAKVEVQDLLGKIRTKLSAGQTTEQDLAPELADFETLLAEHKGDKSDDVADILFTRAILYAQICKDFPKATADLQQLKADFPATADAKRVDPILASFGKMEAAQKIQDSLLVGAAFPDFQVQDLDGKPLSVAAEKGKIVLIDFWATWCGPCVHELPNVLKVYQADHAKGFDIIGVSLDSDKDKLTSFIKDKSMTWPQYFDGKGWENEISTKYGIVSIPATFLIGKDGKIIGKDLRGDALATAVTAALAAN
jgi:peroxiredoxin